MKLAHIPFAAALVAVCFPGMCPPGHSLTVEIEGRERSFAAAEAACSGRVTGVTCFQKPGSGAIYSRASIEVLEVAKGTVPATFDLVYLGGELGDVRMDDSGMPTLKAGDIRMFCLEPSGDGAFSPCNGRVGVWPAVTKARSANGPPPPNDGLIVPNQRIPQVDRGEPIGVIVDVSTRPAGISEAQALTALDNAIASWEAHSFVTFEVLGTETFSQSAHTINDRSRLIRVQMHDNWDHIPDTGITLAVAGGFTSMTDATGGEFSGRMFRDVFTSYIIINHPKTTLSNPVTLEETLAHEIGHTLGLAHSSETDPENNFLLSDALMYFIAHADGRGADPRSWDIDAFRRAYPTNNTPPYSFTRYLKAVTNPYGALANPEVNIIHLVNGDLDGDAITIDVVGSSSGNGTWTRNGPAVTYTPSGWYSDADASDPITSSFDRYQYRIYDGSYYSAIHEVRVNAFRSDTRPTSAADGLPDSWLQTHFGSIDPIAGTSTATDDADADHLTTLEEFVLGSNPTTDDSAIQAVSVAGDGIDIGWLAFPYSVYEIQESLDGGATWSRVKYSQSLSPTAIPRTNTVSTVDHALFRVRTRH